MEEDNKLIQEKNFFRKNAKFNKEIRRYETNSFRTSK